MTVPVVGSVYFPVNEDSFELLSSSSSEKIPSKPEQLHSSHKAAMQTTALSEENNLKCFMH